VLLPHIGPHVSRLTPVIFTIASFYVLWSCDRCCKT